MLYNFFLYLFFFFFFNDTATTEIYTLSLHDALPILAFRNAEGRAMYDSKKLDLFGRDRKAMSVAAPLPLWAPTSGDRKSTRLNSSHPSISYAVFCLKKKKKKKHYERISKNKLYKYHN